MCRTSAHPTVTVVIPYNSTYTDDSLLEEAIETAKDQTVDTKIEVVEDDVGPAYGRNRGLEKAETKFVAFLDADDIWAKDKLERQLVALKSEEGAGISLQADENLSTDRILRNLLLSDLSSITSSILVDTELVSARFNEGLERYEDYMYVVDSGLESGVVPVSDIIEVRKHEGGLTSQGTTEINRRATEEQYRVLRERLPDEWAYRREVLSTKAYNIGRLEQRCGNYRKSFRASLLALWRHGWMKKTVGLLALLPLFYLRDQFES